MKISTLVVMVSVAVLSQNASAEAYKCMKNGRAAYQSKPCEPGAADANKVKIKNVTPEQEAIARQKREEIESKYAEIKDKHLKAEQEQAEKTKEQFEERIKVNDAQAQRDQAAALNRQAEAMEKRQNIPITVGPPK